MLWQKYEYNNSKNSEMLVRYIILIKELPSSYFIIIISILRVNARIICLSLSVARDFLSYCRAIRITYYITSKYITINTSKYYLTLLLH